MATLTVGSGEQYATIAAAVAATQDGDTVLVQAGTYTNDFFTITHKITLQSVGGMVIDIATAQPPNGKAIVTVDTDATIDGFGFTGARVRDGNGAGIRYEGGNLVLNHTEFWNNENGLMGGDGVSNGTILVENSEFGFNGSGSGTTHNIYVGTIGSLTIEDSYFHDAHQGHEIKSRAATTTIINNRIYDNNADTSYSIDLPNGGNDLVEGNVIEKGVNAPNYSTIHFGGEPQHDPGYWPGSSLTVTNNTIINDNANGILSFNQTGGLPDTFIGNQLYGYTAPNTGPVTMVGNTTLATRPTLDMSTMLPAIPPTPAPPVLVSVPVTATLQSWGRTGAVVASGHVLTVGAGGQFRSLSSALSAATNGDTIEVAAGTYVNDFAVVNKNVVIEGVGGIAHFVQQNSLQTPLGIFDVNTDVTLKNLEISGAANYSGHDAGIFVNSGNVTIGNCYIHDNDLGIATADDAGTTVSVFDTEIASNGNEAKETNNISIGAIGSLTMQNDYIHGAEWGHELSSHAFNDDIENNRFIDGAGVTASFSINLGQGGNALIKNNVIEKGSAAVNDILIHVGGEGATYDNSNVQITGNTLVSDMVNPDHPYTYFIVGDPTSTLVPAINATNNVFVGGVVGSGQLQQAHGSNNTTATGAVLDTSAPWSAAAAPALYGAQGGTGGLTVRLSETKGDADAQFLVYVDGIVAGGGTVTADAASGATQDFSFSGNWSAGSHIVVVKATNLNAGLGLYAHSLTVNSVGLNGVTTAPNTTIQAWGLDSSINYLTAGSTNPDFDAAYYLAQNPDVKAAGVDPLAHFLAYGWREGRNPNAFFNTRYYLNQNPDVAASGVNPLLQFENAGWQEGRDPSALFSVSKYLAANPDVAAAGVDPLQSYLQSGQGAGRAAFAAAPHSTTAADPLVDAAYYYAQDPAAAVQGVDASVSYHATFATTGANPDAYFNTAWYLAENPDVAAAGADPLLHFEQYGWKEGRDPSPYFSIKAYDAANPGAATSGVDPLITFLQSGAAPTDPKQGPYQEAENAYFDAGYYLAHNPDVAAAHVDPLLHYEEYGWHEGRNPSASFSTQAYLAANPDVAAAGIDPLRQYATAGVLEHRAIYSVTAP